MQWRIDDLAQATTLTPLPGGWSGRTLLAEALDGTRCVVRVYPPGAGEFAMLPEVEAAVLRLVRGLVPVPEVLEIRRTTTTQPGLMLMSELPGVRADLVLPGLDPDGAAELGQNLGELAATLASMPMLTPGWFTSPTLDVRPVGRMDLVEWIEAQRSALIESTGWAPAAVDRLLGVAERAQDLLDTVPRVCLVHSDFNPKNVLIDPQTLAVTGLLDWEFAHAGHPATDLGNLLRFDRQPAYVDAVLEAYQARHPTTRQRGLDLARAADLMALTELAARSAQAPEGSPARLAAVLLAAVAEREDWHGWPASWTEQAPRA